MLGVVVYHIRRYGLKGYLPLTLHLYIKPFLDCDTQLLFNFDDSVDFPDLERLSQFYKDVLLCYNKVYVKEINEFRHNIGDQCIWANKFIVLPNKKRKSVLFLRN